MHRPESVLENETFKIFWGLEIKMDPWFQVRRPNLFSVNKKKSFQLVEFTVPIDHRVKLKESKKLNKYLNLVRELKNCGTTRWLWYQCDGAIFWVHALSVSMMMKLHAVIIALLQMLIKVHQTQGGTITRTRKNKAPTNKFSKEWICSWMGCIRHFRSFLLLCSPSCA